MGNTGVSSAPKNTPKLTKLGPYSRSASLAKIDGRTREAALMRRVRAEFTAHVGGNPSAVQRALIERAVQLTLRISAMDRKFAETGAQTELDSRTYLAWSGSLSRVLRDLGMNGPPARGPSLSDYIADTAAA